MALIYVLKKDVPDLGRVIKVGMTFRSGDHRAKEYGGGGWVCLREYPVDVTDVSELREIESEILEELDMYKCQQASAFGLKEVFSVEPEVAMAVIQDVLGSDQDVEDDESSLYDKAQRLKERIANRVVQKLLKQFAASYAAVVETGRYEGSVPDTARMYADRNLDPSDIALLRLYNDYLAKLDKSGGDDSVFRAMLQQEREEVLFRLEEGRKWHDEKAEEARRRQQERAELEAARRLERQEKERQNEKRRAEHEALEAARKQAQKEQAQRELIARDAEKREARKRFRKNLWRIIFWTLFLTWLIMKVVRISSVSSSY